MAALGFGGGASSGLGSIANLFSSKMLMKYQHKLTRKLRQEAYKDTMQSMREAGLNPILAYKQGPVTASQGGLATSPKFDVSGGMAAGAAVDQAASAKGLRQAQMVTEGRRQNMLNAQAAQGYAAANLHDRNADIVRTQFERALEQEKFDKTDIGKRAIQVNRAVGPGAGAAINSARKLIFGR